MPELSDTEYTVLSDQKAEDWRIISDVNPSLFAVAGALFAAGVAQHEAFVVALSPAPLFLAVWHMIRHARLQLQMITYLEVFAPSERASWERDLAIVRSRMWANSVPRIRGTELPSSVAQLLRPSAWNTWIAIAAALSVLAALVPVLSSYPSCGWAALASMIFAGLAVCGLAWQANKVQPEREAWAALWDEYAAESRADAKPQEP